MTSFPAQKMGLFDRGLLRPGMRADIAVIDLARIRDNATNRWPHEAPFENYPHRYPDGIPVRRGERQARRREGQAAEGTGGRGHQAQVALTPQSVYFL